jgi:hypothetical protein
MTGASQDEIADSLVFKGTVINGRGGHAELGVPGRHELPSAPEDWPESFFAGSLNVLVSHYPIEFTSRGLRHSVKVLDTARFDPAFTIPQSQMRNNKLTPTPAMPHRGTAQVWRAMLTANDQTTRCWVLRRIGSGLDCELELVSGEGLRASLGLDRALEWSAQVTMWGHW